MLIETFHAMCAYYDVSEKLLSQMIAEGLPYSRFENKVGKPYVFNTADCARWMRANGYGVYLDSRTLNQIAKMVERETGTHPGLTMHSLRKWIQMGMPAVRITSGSAVREGLAWMKENYNLLTEK